MQDVLQADWQELAHSLQPGFFKLSLMLVLLIVLICFIINPPFLKHSMKIIAYVGFKIKYFIDLFLTFQIMLLLPPLKVLSINPSKKKHPCLKLLLLCIELSYKSVIPLVLQAIPCCLFSL